MGVDTSTTVRVYITNKDTLSVLALALVVNSLSGGAYMKLVYPHNFGGAARLLDADSSLQFFSIFGGADYNSVPPDSILVGGYGDPRDHGTYEAPNLTRKAFLELRFDSVFLNGNASTGLLEIDSLLIYEGPSGDTHPGRQGSSGFLSAQNQRIFVNFLKGRINIVRPTQPCYGADMNGDSLLNISDVVEALNCVFFGGSKCQRVVTTLDILSLFYEVFPTGVVFRPPPGC